MAGSLRHDELEPVTLPAKRTPLQGASWTKQNTIMFVVWILVLCITSAGIIVFVDDVFDGLVIYGMVCVAMFFSEIDLERK